MKIIKGANAGGGCVVSGEELALINALARKELKAEEVYTFAVRLCDNEIDREWERFPRETLEALAEMFVGKSGIFDHSWSAQGQSARIYKTEVVEEDGLTRAGDRACYLKGWAYMLRTEGSAELIAQIEGGIKKEVSVGCSVEKAVCSICGEELGQCRHVKGRTYNGKLCWAELTGAKDAYEWSFVAVPAQRRAGVIKGMGPSLKELARQRPETRRELEELEKTAGLGRRYLEELRGEVVRLGAVCEPELDVAVARSIAGKLDEEELKALKGLFFPERGEEMGRGAQLTYMGAKEPASQEDGAFWYNFLRRRSKGMVGKVSFEGIGAVTATFHAGEGVEAGQVVKLSGDAAVEVCAAGERFCGVAGAVREGCAPVQVGGLAQVKCEDKAVTAGYVSLTADGKGGVKKAASGDKGQEYLVVAADGDGVTIKM